MVPTRARILLGALLLGLAALAAPARADEDADSRRRALALNNITGEDPIQGEIKTLVQDAAGTKKLLAVAVPMAKEKDQPFSYNAAYILARSAHGLKDLEAARVFYRVCINQAVKLLSGQKLAQSYEGLINLLTQHKQLDDIVKVSEEFLALPDDGANMKPVSRLKSAVLLRMIPVMARQGQTEKAGKLVERLLEAQPDNWILVDMKGRVQREAGKLEEAAKTYEEVLQLIKKDKNIEKDSDRAEILEEYRHALSGIYVDMNRVDKAAEILKALLAEKPDHPTYNNDLGYIWADHDMNLEESERLIRKALEEDRKQRQRKEGFRAEDDKDNAAYLDSLGWVLFKQKKYEEAKKYLVQAVADEEGQHIEILDHLGDVHMALGEKAEALAVWKKAVALEGMTKREQQRKVEVEKKIKVNE